MAQGKINESIKEKTLLAFDKIMCEEISKKNKNIRNSYEYFRYKTFKKTK